LSARSDPRETEQRRALHDASASTTGFKSAALRARRFWPLLIPLLGLCELVLHLYFAHRAPRPEEWEDLRPAVTAWYGPDKVVVVAPQWAEPIARWKLGDALMPLRDVARGDVSRYAHALEISAMGRRSPELVGWSIVRETRHGRFALRELQNPQPAHVLYNFSDYLLPPHTEVHVQQGGASTLCNFTSKAPVESGGLGAPPTFPESRFICPGQPPQVFVGLTIIEDGEFRPRRCIWSQAPAAGGALMTRFKSVPLGDAIQGHAGMGYLYERDKPNPPFTIAVAIDGTEVGRMVHNDGDFWKPFSIPLAEHGHRVADVEFRVSAPPNGSPVCFEADSR
jgi:hypothetical protein